MRRALPLLSTAVLLLVPGWAAAAPAPACSCATASTEQQFEQADAVFTASLRSSADGGATADGAALQVLTAHVVFKGEVHEAQGVASAADGDPCGVELPGDEPFLVFAERSPELPEGGYTLTSCGGTGPLDPAVVAELSELTTLTTSTGAPGALPLEGSAGTDDDRTPWELHVLGAAAAVAAVGGTALLMRRRSTAAR